MVRYTVGIIPILERQDQRLSEVVLLTGGRPSSVAHRCFRLRHWRLSVSDKRSIEYPIAFMSKTLTESQIKNWTTTEKEAYAIVVAFEKFEYLLRDVRFLLRTDHRNLTFLDDSYKGRVIRWKLAIQEYNFAVEHIPGKDNIVADALSRDLPNNTTVNSVETLDAMTPSSTHGDVASNPTREVALQQQARPVDELLADSLEVRLPDDIYRKIELAHNPTVGHHGVDQTMRLLRESGHTWPDMRAHVSRFIRKCPTCQKLSEIKPHVSTPPYTGCIRTWRTN
jgi:hypothetical protein